MHDMETNKDAQEVIIFIPAFDAKEKDYYVNHYLAVGLANRLEDKRVYLEPGEVKISGQTGKRFTFQSNLRTKKIDIYEIYWRDLIDDLNDKSIGYRVFRGIYLFFYWLFASPKIGKISRVFFFQVLGILFLIIAWEYSTVTVALTAIGNDPNALGFHLPSELAKTLGQLGKTFGGWQIWLVTSAILSVLPVPTNVLINLLDFMVRYAEDDTERGLASLRDKLRGRLVSVLDDVLNENSYEKITVLAHSLGTVLAVDFLADYKHSSTKKISFITLGSPLKPLASVSNWISQEVMKCVDNDSVEKWFDFYSDQDWLCTKAPVSSDTENGKFQATAISLRVSLAKQISGESHFAYFFDRFVLEKIIE
jgi:pimeloyl-ACP methyl ester carboxylesterase